MTECKNISRWILLVLVLFLVACDNSEEDLAPPASLSFSDSPIAAGEVSSDGGTLTFDVNWAFTRWTARAGDVVRGKAFINTISPGAGGSADHGTSQTTVTVVFDANLTATDNQQKIVLSSPAGDLSDTILVFQAAKAVKKINVTFDPNTSYQTISGFGGANMIWGTDYLTESEMDLAFGTGENGLGLSIYRVRLSSNKNDWGGLVSSIKGANERNVEVLASPWSPPAEWKSNNSVNGGGYLLEEHYADFANYINEFVQYMDGQGAKVDVVSIQNEPDWVAGYEGCEYTTSGMYNFVKNYAGTITGAKVLAAESLNSKHSYTDNILNDAQAAEKLDIVGGHLYGSGIALYTLAEQKGKEIWMTEHLLNLNSGNNPDNWTTNTPAATIWNETMEMVTEIQSCMSYNWNAYIWWYIRRYYSFLGDGEKGTTRGQILKRGYAMSQFSKFIRPGYVRIKAELDNPSTALNVTAYQGDNKLVVVAINPSDSDISGVTINMQGASFTAVAYTTSEFVNREMESLMTDNATVNFTIPAKSITTVVISN
ncbi:glycoside hydrolase family 30 beta sandwich domain-containing protein [Mangrovibacterium sp.]|uniref:glycoside hydrolase family 30 protein n=1 Tax=Mangrovibacterium sp. TaxID=1961364 RepID=UPI0035631D8B